MFCPNCGKQIPDGSSFCPECGSKVTNSDTTRNTYQNSYQNSAQSFTENNGSSNNFGPAPGCSRAHEGMRKGIGLSILLSIVTCGIYYWIWVANVNDNINTVSGHYNDTSGGMVVLFTIITCGIYGIYWAYKMGTKVNEIDASYGACLNGSNHILFLILSLLELDIVNVAIMQDRINKCI